MANLENLYESPKGVSRSITAENFTGAAGSGGMAVGGEPELPVQKSLGRVGKSHHQSY